MSTGSMPKRIGSGSGRSRRSALIASICRAPGETSGLIAEARGRIFVVPPGMSFGGPGRSTLSTRKRRITMKMLASLLSLGLMATPALAATQTFSDVSVVDVACAKKVAADTDSHTRDCALMCEKSGYGIVTAGKRFRKFDAHGPTTVAALWL